MAKAEQVDNLDKSLTGRIRTGIKNIDGNVMRLWIAVIVILILLGLARPDTFLTWRNMQSMAFQASEIGILSIAIMVSMLSGGIDLSIVSTANLAGILAGLILTAMVPADAGGGTVALAMTLAIVAAVFTGFLAGAFNGFLVAVMGMPPILATLGTLLMYKGIGTGISKGSTIFGIQQSQFIGNGTILSIPFPLILLVAIAIVISIILNRSRFGLRLYMLGTNPIASRFSGINNRQILMRSYVISGMLAATAGIVILGRTNGANVDFGGSYILLSILIAVLGGVNPYGGSGTVIGVMLALVALQFLSTGFNMLLFRSSGANFFKEFSWGALLIIILVVNYFSHKRRERKAALESSAESKN
ncbi:MAG: ABC transporter permease [Chloroflexota bacterium]|nr:MAG: ABC transporter permease [Chloroflexota bacterium]